MSHDEELGKVISILKAENKRYEYPIGFIPIEEGRAIILKGKVEGEHMQFYFGYAEDALTEIGPVLDCSLPGGVVYRRHGRHLLPGSDRVWKDGGF